ncbi:hypothetical protein [Polaromonas sp.]|uniref:hypothetical protein n=1 Tax=Polaromonas sp. TaxID=1869339 RepID=UPI003BACE6D8
MLDRIAISFLLLVWSWSASAQNVESIKSRERFHEALHRNDYAEVERLHNFLVSGKNRTAQGVFLADIHTDFSDLTDCNHNVARGPVGTAPTPAMDSESCRIQQESRLDAWAKKYPSSVLPFVGRSITYIDRANSLNPVQHSASIARDKYLDQALLALDAAPAKIREPIWYVTRMEVATLQGWGSKRYWPLVTEAASKFPGHSLIYRKALNHFLPRNGGSAKEIEELAQLAVSKSMRLDGSSMYAHIYDEVILGQGGLWQNAYLQTELSWPTMRLGLEDIYKRFPDPWNLNRFAQHACLASDMPTLKRLLSSMRKDEVPTAYDGWGRGELTRCRELAARKPTAGR